MMNLPIQLFTDRTQLKGTCYYEFQPGKFSLQRKHWQPGSVFIQADVFWLFEGIFRRYLQGYAAFGFVDICASDWPPLVAELIRISHVLAEARDYSAVAEFCHTQYERINKQIAKDFQTIQPQLFQLLQDLTAWLSAKLQAEEFISTVVQISFGERGKKGGGSATLNRVP